MDGFRRELNAIDFVKMKIPARFQNSSIFEIDNKIKIPLSSDSDEHKTLSALVTIYVKNIEQMFDEGIGFYLWGANGTGKTCTACLVLMEARRRGHTCLFLESLSMKEIVINKEMFDDETSLWERAKTVDMLLIDDVGKGVGDSTGFGNELIKSLIKHRSAEKKVTWITANMNQKEFEETYKVTTTSSMKECIIPIKVSGQDRREESKAQIVSTFTKQNK